jgi:two-component system phosphate regulon sensor histidine kinase PhoR
MSGFVSRVLRTALLVFLGAWAGAALGLRWGVPSLGAAVGGALTAGLLGVVELLRAHRLLSWLRGDKAQVAPRDPGLWGELGYRIERALRVLEKSVAAETSRLDQFLSAIEVSPNGVMVLDRNDHIEWINSSAADHFGLDPVRDRGQRVTNLVRSPDFVAHLQSGKVDESVTFRGPHSRGTLQVLVRRFGEGMKLVLSQDVTERERNEAMRRDFVANVSHEIRTPLTVLAGFIETMGSLPLTDVERRRVIELMGQQTQRMQMLVADLLILAQLEGSPRPSADRWSPVRRLLDQASADAVALSGGRHRISVQWASPAGEIAGTEAELGSAVSNLVTNAVRYTPAGGSVDIRWATRDDGSGEIEVKDSGIGIDKEHLPRVTERFYRVDGSRSRDTGGTGLGLSIVKHVIQRHGGELEIRSEPGQGSSFKLVFPAARVRAGVPGESPVVPDPARGTVVDHADGL